MTHRDDRDVVRSTRELTAAEQQALVAQCSRCVLRDSSPWIGAGALAGVAVGLVSGDAWFDVVAPVALAVALAVVQVVRVRSGLRSQLPVGLRVDTVTSAHHLSHVLGSLALPKVTRIRTEGRVLRLDYGKDHSHLLPDHVDLDVLRQRAGVSAPEPVPGSGRTLVEVPADLAARAARHLALWQALRGVDVVPAWAVTIVLLVLGQWSLATTVAVSQVGALSACWATERRRFDRSFPSGIPLEVEWRGRTLEIRSVEGLAVVDVAAASTAKSSADMFVVRRHGMPPLVLPDVVVSDAVRAELQRTN